jgi:hypothetical protein
MAALDKPLRAAGAVWKSATQSNMAINIIFLVVTGIVAYHGLTWRDEEGESDFVRLLFGAIALLFFFRVLLVDVLEVWG